MKKVIFLIIVFFNSITVVNANTVSNIDMDIYVDNNGTANVTETWNAIVTKGTEGWHPYYNIGKSEIYDVRVKMDGQEYTTVSSWVENSSLSDKAYKAGLYYPESKEVDIVFGISSYGNHEYEVQYKISNFVSTLEDADMIYWNLIPYDFSAQPGNVTIKIYSDFKYNDNWDVWGYGKYGAPCYIYDGVIEMTSDGVLNSNEYLTILVKFPKGTFNTNSVLDNDFDYYYKMAEKGATHYNESKNETTNYNNKESIEEKEWKIIGIIIGILIFIPWIIIGLFASSKATHKVNIKFGRAGNKVRKDVLPFRDIPCNNDIFRAYWVADNYNLKKKQEDFLGAVILKWVKNNNVIIERNSINNSSNTKDKTTIVFNERPKAIELEKTLYDYMKEASNDGKLEINEFKKWCSKNSKKILNWYEEISQYELDTLVNEGKAKIIAKGKVLKYNVYEIDDCMMQEAEQLKGLQKFLKNFSVIETREPIEVKLWNEYLMYAQIFGMAEEVARQFKKLYPEIIQDMEKENYNYNDIYYVYYITTKGFKSAYHAEHRSISYDAANDYTSGGGGFSSGGGGGGAFGSGNGGGGFR